MTLNDFSSNNINNGNICKTAKWNSFFVAIFKHTLEKVILISFWCCIIDNWKTIVFPSPDVCIFS